MIHARYGIIQDAMYLSEYLRVKLGLLICTGSCRIASFTDRIALDSDQLLHHPRILISRNILQLPSPSEFALYEAWVKEEVYFKEVTDLFP